MPFIKLPASGHYSRMRTLGRAAAMLSAALALTACNRAEGVAKSPTPMVTVAHAVSGDTINWDRFTGRFEAVNHVELRPRVKIGRAHV